jgi:hypothetical protein
MQVRRQWLLLGALPVCSILFGALETAPARLLDTDSLFSTWMAALFVLLVVRWYRVDAHDRAYRTTWGLNIAMVLVTAFALPWYLVRSRDGYRIALALLGATLMFVLCALMYRAGSALAGNT